MSEETKVAKKTGFFDGLKSEFRKIIWPSKNSLIRQTVAVVVATVILALVIAGIDWLVQLFLDVIVNL